MASPDAEGVTATEPSIEALFNEAASTVFCVVADPVSRRAAAVGPVLEAWAGFVATQGKRDATPAAPVPCLPPVRVGIRAGRLPPPAASQLIPCRSGLYPSVGMEKLKLSALDAEDLDVISAAVQDSLVAVRDCAFFAAEKRFVLLLNRFCWEADPGVESRYWRTHSALVFNDVQAVHHHKIPTSQPDRVLELLSVIQDSDRSVTLRFAADRAIRLEIGRLACHLGDVGEPWPTPWKPAHPVE